MVRDGDDSAGARRARVTRRRRRRGRQLPSRRRHRRPRRLVRLSVPSKTNKLRLSRDNIQLHPLTSDSSSVPRVNGAQYVSQVPGAAHYVMMPAGYRLDTGSLASPVIIQPLSSSTFDSRLGLVSTSPEVIGLADRKATPSIETNYASDGELVFPVAVAQSSLGVADVDVNTQPVRLVTDHLSPSTVQLLTANNDRLTLPVRTANTRPVRRPRTANTATLRTLPQVRTPSPTYIILKLSGNEGIDASGKERSRRGEGVLAEESVQLDDKVKYIDLSTLLSTSHLSVTSSPPTTSRRPPTSWRAKPARRRRPRPTAPRWSKDRPGVPPAPAPPHQEPSNTQPFNHELMQLPRYHTNQRRYQPSPRPYHHHQHQQHQRHQQQQQRQYQVSNEHQHHSHVPQRYQVHSGAIPPLYAPTAV